MTLDPDPVILIECFLYPNAYSLLPTISSTLTHSFFGKKNLIRIQIQSQIPIDIPFYQKFREHLYTNF